MDIHLSVVVFDLSPYKEFMALTPRNLWLILITLTLLSVSMFETELLRELSVLVIIAIAGYKSRLVILHFMEATHAPGHFRFMYETWNFVVCAIIVIGHYMALIQNP